MIFERLGGHSPGKRVLHIAPELALMRELSRRYGPQYHARDYEPENYTNDYCSVEKIDLCHDVEKIQADSYDLIIHNHVLEHVSCDVGTVIKSLNRILAPGGRHFFSVPFRGALTCEDLSPDLTPDDRVRLFAQKDHMRIFGTRDFPEFLKHHFNGTINRVDPKKYFELNELIRARIPAETYNQINGHSIFLYDKPL